MTVVAAIIVAARKTRHRITVPAVVMITLSAAAIAIGSTDAADPPVDPDFSDLQGMSGYPEEPLTKPPAMIHPLPVVTPRPSNLQPQFPYPYNKVRGRVTDTDTTALRELCQWYNAQFEDLQRQIEALQYFRITPNGPGVINGSGSDWDYSKGNVQEQVDIVTTNIDQSVDFLAPRVQAFSQDQDNGGDVYFPLDQAKSFYLLWQHLSNVNAGIKSHQPDWFTGPSFQRVKRNGSVINRSGVCRY